MSAETDLRTLLLATGAVTALVGTRISADRIEQGAARPFIVFARSGTDRLVGLDGTLHGVRVTLDIQCWADTRVNAEAVASAIELAIESVHQFVTARTGDYDPELDLEASLLTVDWWES